MIKISLKILAIGVFLGVCSCTTPEKETYRFEQGTAVEPAVYPFHQDVFDLDTNSMESSVMQLRQKYPSLAPLYFNQLVGLKRQDTEDKIFHLSVSRFLNNPLAESVKKAIDGAYPDINDLDDSFAQAIGNYVMHFPDRDTPSVYTVYTEFGYFPFLFSEEDGSDAIGVSLEMFLGDAFPYESLRRNSPVFSEYNLPFLEKKYLVRKAIEVLVDDMVPPPKSGTLLDYMIYQGKKLFILSELIREPQEIVHEYTTEQMAWVTAHEYGIWRHFVSEELLYSKKDLHKYVDYAPSTIGMPKESPGRVANWIGYRIVQSYVSRQSIKSLEALLTSDDPQGFLRASGYKPDR